MGFKSSYNFREVPAFKRMFYDSLIKFIDESEFNFCALLGSRQVGKTIALKQVFFTRQDSSQILLCNFKEIGSDEQEEFVCSTLDRIEAGNLDLLLLDEITYLDGY